MRQLVLKLEALEKAVGVVVGMVEQTIEFNAGQGSIVRTMHYMGPDR